MGEEALVAKRGRAGTIRDRAGQPHAICRGAEALLATHRGAEDRDAVGVHPWLACEERGRAGDIVAPAPPESVGLTLTVMGSRALRSTART